MQAPWHFVAANLFLGAGFAAGALFPITIAITLRAQERTALAIGIAAAGSSFGSFALMPALQALIEAIGWRATYVAMGLAVVATPLPFLAFVLPRGRLAPNDTDTRPADPAAPTTDAPARRGPAAPITREELLRPGVRPCCSTSTSYCSISYAVPGTVLAIGLLIPLARLDNSIDAVMRSLFGISTGLLLSGTAFAIVLAYTIRFLAASLGAVEGGLSRISRHIDDASRTLGASLGETLRKVHLPMLRPALGAAALLVFVDSMKELPATLLLRPFNFDTLATQVFTLASLYRYEEAGLAALSIVAVSLAPVLLLHGIIAGSRPGASPARHQAAASRPNAALGMS